MTRQSYILLSAIAVLALITSCIASQANAATIPDYDYPEPPPGMRIVTATTTITKHHDSAVTAEYQATVAAMTWVGVQAAACPEPVYYSDLEDAVITYVGIPANYKCTVTAHFWYFELEPTPQP